MYFSRSSFQLRVGVRGIRVVSADGVNVDLPTHPQDLEDFILSQVGLKTCLSLSLRESNTSSSFW